MLDIPEAILGEILTLFLTVLFGSISTRKSLINIGGENENEVFVIIQKRLYFFKCHPCFSFLKLFIVTVKCSSMSSISVLEKTAHKIVKDMAEILNFVELARLVNIRRMMTTCMFN